MKRTLIIFFISCWVVSSFGQAVNIPHEKIEVNRLMDSLWIHPTSFLNQNDLNWIRLNEHLQDIDILQLNELIHSIYFGSNSFMLNRSRANEGFIGTLNRTADSQKIRKFHKKIRKGFRNPQLYPNHKVVLVEGDSWFEYPVFLKDISDHLEKNPNLAIYSLAQGSDWVANMISNLQYEYDYVKIKPDVFIISGGGNDMVGDYRLSNFVRLNPLTADDSSLKHYRNYVLLRLMRKPAPICNSDTCHIENPLFRDSASNYTTKVDTVLVNQIANGRRFLNENFYRFLVTIKLEYKILFESLRKVDPVRFDEIKIITQGYDYAIPSYKRRFGLRIFFDNGEWLKEPLMMSGINDPEVQQSVVKAIIFEMNEMFIELGKEYNNVYHVDSRGITAFYEKFIGKKPGTYWYDELHPKSNIFEIISQVYTDIIDNRTPPKEQVINVIDSFLESNKQKK